MAFLPNSFAQSSFTDPSGIGDFPDTFAHNFLAARAVTAECSAAVTASLSLRSGATFPMKAVVSSSARFGLKSPSDESFNSPSKHFPTGKKGFSRDLRLLGPWLVRLLLKQLIKHVEHLRLFLP